MRRSRSLARRWCAPLLLALVLACPATRAGAALPGKAPVDSLHFLIESEGATAGWMTAVRTVHADGRVVYRGGGTMGGTTSLKWTLEMTPDLRSFVRATSWLKTPQQELEISSVHVPDGKPEVSATVNGTKMPVPAEKLPAQAVYLPQGAATALMALSDLLASQDAATYAATLAATNGLQKLDLAVRGLGSGTLTQKGAEVPVRTFELTVSHKELKPPLVLKLYQRPDGSFFGVETPQGRILRSGGAAADGPAAGPGGRETTVAGDGVALAATLTVPAPGADPAARAAGVVLVAGPAQAGRDAVAGDFGFYAHLAAELAASGIATLRYEPRPPAGGALALEDMARDAAAAAAALGAAAGVDPAKILLLVQGEGGMLAGEAAALCAQAGQPVRGLILVGATTSAGADLHAAQPRPADAPWLASFLARDPRPALLAAGLPVMLLHGDRDDAVPSTEATALKEWLNAQGHLKVACTVAVGLDHCLREVPAAGGAPAPECAKGVVKRIAGFVAQCTR
ncbi:MAG: alpha/beta hydrolase [bacterium]|nr:alpha/beta hydrolase [bacterium]